MITIYSSIIPGNKCINDNWGQHYRSQIGALEWLTWQYESIKRGYWEKPVGRGEKKTFVKESYIAPAGFHIPSKSEVHEHLNLGKDVLVNIRCEVWRCTEQRFDPHNYAHTIKQPLDLLVNEGYIEDDDWQHVNSMTFTGGGRKAWSRHADAVNQTLPDDISPEWWREQLSGECIKVINDKTDLTGIMIRILLDRA